MPQFRILLSVEVVLDADDRKTAEAHVTPLISKLSFVRTEEGVEVNDVAFVVCENLDEELDDDLVQLQDYDDSRPCGDPDCSCS
jgi:hypothetical protein